MSKGYFFALFIFLIFFAVIFSIKIKDISEKINIIQKQTGQIESIQSANKYLVSVNHKDNWIMVNLDPNDFEIVKKGE